MVDAVPADLVTADADAIKVASVTQPAVADVAAADAVVADALVKSSVVDCTAADAAVVDALARRNAAMDCMAVAADVKAMVASASLAVVHRVVVRLLSDSLAVATHADAAEPEVTSASRLDSITELQECTVLFKAVQAALVAVGSSMGRRFREFLRSQIPVRFL